MYIALSLCQPHWRTPCQTPCARVKAQLSRPYLKIIVYLHELHCCSLFGLKAAAMSCVQFKMKIYLNIIFASWHQGKNILFSLIPESTSTMIQLLLLNLKIQQDSILHAETMSNKFPPFSYEAPSIICFTLSC